jgi:hypothetical protein
MGFIVCIVIITLGTSIILVESDGTKVSIFYYYILFFSSIKMIASNDLSHCSFFVFFCKAIFVEHSPTVSNARRSPDNGRIIWRRRTSDNCEKSVLYHSHGGRQKQRFITDALWKFRKCWYLKLRFVCDYFFATNGWTNIV